MEHWLIITNDSDTEPTVTGRKVQATRLGDLFYGIKESAANAKKLKPGDKAVFYIAGKQGGYFSADATLRTGLVELTPEEREKFWHSPAFQATHGVFLEEDINIWNKKVYLGKAIDEIASFSKFKDNPGNAVRGTIKSLSEEDYRALVALGNG